MSSGAIAATVAAACSSKNRKQDNTTMTPKIPDPFKYKVIVITTFPERKIMQQIFERADDPVNCRIFMKPSIIDSLEVASQDVFTIDYGDYRRFRNAHTAEEVEAYLLSLPNVKYFVETAKREHLQVRHTQLADKYNLTSTDERTLGEYKTTITVMPD